MESWRNRKTLILSRTDMMGLLEPGEYNDRAEHAYRMHGEGRYYMEPKGHIVLDKYPGEWKVMPSYIEEPEAAACEWVSIRAEIEFSIKDISKERWHGGSGWCGRDAQRSQDLPANNRAHPGHHLVRRAASRRQATTGDGVRPEPPESAGRRSGRHPRCSSRRTS